MSNIFKLVCFAGIIMSMSLISCEKGDDDDDDDDDISNTCDVSNPTKELGWLMEAIDDIKQDEYSYYAMANYKGETVFYYVNCNPLANYVSIVKNCVGDDLGNANDLRDELTDIITLWKHENSKCNF